MWLIVKTLFRNKGSFLLMSLQVAITLAVLINALALVKGSREIINEPTGIDAKNIIAIHVVPFDQSFNDPSVGEAQLRQDLDFLRTYPGVIDASVTNSFPGDVGSDNGLGTPGMAAKSYVDAGTYSADSHLLHTLGVRLVAGRNFAPEEIFFSPWPPADKKLPKVIIITQVAAKKLFGDKSALGRTVDIDGTRRVVIGVTGTYRGRTPLLGDAGSDAFLPGYASGRRLPESYLVRVEPGTASRMMGELKRGLLKLNDGRDVDEVRLVSDLLSRGNGLYAYGGLVLMVISALLVFTTALGVFGVAYFSVTKRTRQIGIRRALGATRTTVMQHFLIENLLTTGSGVVLGSVLAVALNIQMTKLGLGRTDWMVTGLGILFVIAVSQLSVLLPAWKASLVDPAIATRA